MHYFITGHTGFKGAWLTALLKSQGHLVSGYALPAVEGSLFELAELSTDLENNWLADIRDSVSLSKAISRSRPDRIVHLAAQSLVLRSYEDPDETFTTNLGGTLNLLSATASLNLDPEPQVLVVTTDKVYLDQGQKAYDEEQPLGGSDPYSSSKALADLLTQSWIQNFPNSSVLIARAGNVIGEYDTNPNRLIPDAIRALEEGTAFSVRNPDHIRPWQHVLDCVSGYIAYMDTAKQNSETSRVMNFGPSQGEQTTVGAIVSKIASLKPELKIELSPGTGTLETQTLMLDTSRAERQLRWRNRIGLDSSLERILYAPTTAVREYLYSSIKDFIQG